MKTRILLFIIILAINNLIAEALDDFRRLSASEKIEKILEDYRYDRNWNRWLRFSQYTTILAETPSESIPVLFRYLENLNMLPLQKNDYGFIIVDNIINREFYVNKKILSRNQIKKWVSILQQKINNYLENNKTIDVNIVLLESRIERIKNDRDIFSLPNVAQIILDKYSDLGFSDLIVIYEPYQ